MLSTFGDVSPGLEDLLRSGNFDIVATNDETQAALDDFFTCFGGFRLALQDSQIIGLEWGDVEPSPENVFDPAPAPSPLPEFWSVESECARSFVYRHRFNLTLEKRGGASNAPRPRSRPRQAPALPLSASDKLALARFIETVANLTPAQGKAPAQIGAGMLNNLIESAQALKLALPRLPYSL